MIHLEGSKQTNRRVPHGSHAGRGGVSTEGHLHLLILTISKLCSICNSVICCQEKNKSKVTQLVWRWRARIGLGELQDGQTDGGRKGLTRAGTTVLTGKPPSVSSLPITSSWHISMAAWSCCDSSPVACRPCRSCWALEPGEQEERVRLGVGGGQGSGVKGSRHSLAPLPMVL